MPRDLKRLVINIERPGRGAKILISPKSEWFPSREAALRRCAVILRARKLTIVSDVFDVATETATVVVEAES